MQSTPEPAPTNRLVEQFDEKQQPVALGLGWGIPHRCFSTNEGKLAAVLPMTKRKRRFTIDPDLAKEAKSIAIHAFRNGPIEDIHAGTNCPRCAGREKYSHITDCEMKLLNKTFVNRVYTLLWLKTHEPEKYKAVVELGALFASGWDEPEFDFKF